jgi:hypothetical protein
MMAVDTGLSCAPVVWDVVKAAQSFSALAGLIAGFVLTGLIVLLVERLRQFNRALVPALMLFFAGFVGLGLNSYIFALVSGESADACRRVWTAASVSSGLLAAGVVAAVGGVVLLVHSYVTSIAGMSPAGDRAVASQQFELLRKLLRGSFLLIVVMVISLVMVRHLESLWVWQGRVVISSVPALIIGAIVVAFTGLSILLFRPASSSARRVADPSTRLYWGSVVAVAHSVLGTIILGSFLSLTHGTWASAPAWWGWIIVMEAVLPLVAIALFAMGVARLLEPSVFVAGDGGTTLPEAAQDGPASDG